MSEKLTKESWQHIAGFLPKALSKALSSYHEFMEHDAPVEDAKQFAAHHSAAKVAIAHVELLMKLAKQSEPPKENTESDGIEAMVVRAEQEVTGYKHRQEHFKSLGEQEGEEDE